MEPASQDEFAIEHDQETLEEEEDELEEVSVSKLIFAAPPRDARDQAEGGIPQLDRPTSQTAVGQ